MSNINQKVIVRDALGKELEHLILVPNFELVSEYKLDLYFYYVVKAENANIRTNNACTKTRAEVRGGGRKIRPQKGTGFARQSSIRAPHWKGGGVVFGPNKGRNYVQKVNRKLRNKLMGLLLMKNIANLCVINDNLDKALEVVFQLYNKGYTPNDILLTFMKYLMENQNNNLSEINHEYILKIYEIISLSYIRVNGGIDTLLQLCGCISKIHLYFKS
jgi:large subunit ribosomal protein L4